jgi:hypothetical protein
MQRAESSKQRNNDERGRPRAQPLRWRGSKVNDPEDEKAERPMRGVTREVARAKAEAGSRGTNLEEVLLAAFFNLQERDRVRLRRRENLRRVIRDGDLESHTVGKPRCTKMNRGEGSKQFDLEAKMNRVRGRRKRSEPHGRLQDATSLRRSSGGNRRSRVERQGRNEPGGGSSRPKGESSEALASR